MELVIDKKEEPFASFLKKLTWKDFEDHIIEQISFRVHICRTCVENKKCDFCKCNVTDTLTDPISCNEKKRFHNFKGKTEWELFKQQHNIRIL